MQPKTILLCLCSLALASCTSHLPQPASYSGGPFSELERLKQFESRRESSCKPDWRNENKDAIQIEPGATAVIAELEGPGRIAHLWLTISHPDPWYASKMTVRMYWDGEEHPSVECPIGDFFAVGLGLVRPVVSLPIKVSSEGRGRNCYWPIPFRKSARITISNESDQACRGLYYYVDWQKYKSLPDDTAYFHAMYRQEFPCVMGTNFVIADIVGRGHYAGTVQSVYQSRDGWFGEGDDFFFIDGAAEPILRGTGTEDYFCDGWGFRLHDGPFYGVSVYEGRKAGDRGTAYRFHIPDPVVFQKALHVEIEHKGQVIVPDQPPNPFVERDDLMSSVAFWYQTEPHKPWPSIPAGSDRVPFNEQRIISGVDAVKVARHSDAPAERQTLPGRGARKQLWFKPDASDASEAWIEIPFRLEEVITGDFEVSLTRASDYGMYRVLLDGQDAGAIDLYGPVTEKQQQRLGRYSLQAGEHVLRFECLGKHPFSRGFFMGFEELSVRVPKYLPPK